MKIAIVGFGREGRSIYKFLKSRIGLKQYGRPEIFILDRDKKIKVPKGAQIKLGKNYLKNPERFDIIFRSPGVPYNLAELRKAEKTGVKLSSSTKLFFENYKEISDGHLKIIGVTGTKGKGTTSTLIYNILKTAGKKVFLAGNIGQPVIDFLLKNNKYSLGVIELSSFQLQDLESSPEIAVILDLFPDHQDIHPNLKDYYSSKANISRHQKKQDKVFFFKETRGENMAKMSAGKKIPANLKNFKLFKERDLKIKGVHNFQNAVMAATVTKNIGVSEGVIKSTIKRFKGLSHRLEFIRAIGNVEFYNDSASTNPQTTAAAINSFPKSKKIIIAGGQDKNLDYSPLAEALEKAGREIEAVILLGENKNKIRKVINKSQIDIRQVDNLTKAIKLSHQIAVNNRDKCKIIFSPAAASFDMFKNYADRGDKFKKIVRSLK